MDGDAGSALCDLELQVALWYWCVCMCVDGVRCALAPLPPQPPTPHPHPPPASPSPVAPGACSPISFILADESHGAFEERVQHMVEAQQNRVLHDDEALVLHKFRKKDGGEVGLDTSGTVHSVVVVSPYPPPLPRRPLSLSCALAFSTPPASTPSTCFVVVGVGVCVGGVGVVPRCGWRAKGRRGSEAWTPLSSSWCFESL
jgi:hypothetical protein